MVETLSLSQIQSASHRLQPYIRRSPIFKASHSQVIHPHPCKLFLKLEQLQLTGSFKIRGATNKLLKLSKNQRQNGIIAASGGNHGRAVAYLGHRHQVKTTIFLPVTTPKEKVDAIAQWKVNIEMVGSTLDEATDVARKRAQDENAAFIHPFADPDVISGQGTLGLEILEDFPHLDTLLVPIGGGGLISGIAVAIKSLNPKIKVIGVEPKGCPTLFNSLKKGHVVSVPKITTEVGTLAIQKTSELNFQLVQEYVDDIVLVSDPDMYAACDWLWKEFGIASEMSGAASVSALLLHKKVVSSHESVCAIISGVGRDAICA